MKLEPLKPEDSLCLPGMEDADRERLEAQTQAEALTAELLKPLADVSTAAGEMERDSPLFFGTGNNPSLF